MRPISSVLLTPPMSHRKPGARGDGRGPELHTHQPRQLCLGPRGTVRRAHALMGPDGLCLVCGHVPPPPSHSDFLACSCPPETEEPFVNERGLKVLFLPRLRAAEPSDVSMSNHGTFCKAPAAGFLWKPSRVVIGSKMKREPISTGTPCKGTPGQGITSRRMQGITGGVVCSKPLTVNTLGRSPWQTSPERPIGSILFCNPRTAQLRERAEPRGCWLALLFSSTKGKRWVSVSYPAKWVLPNGNPSKL